MRQYGAFSLILPLCIMSRESDIGSRSLSTPSSPSRHFKFFSVHLRSVPQIGSRCLYLDHSIHSCSQVRRVGFRPRREASSKTLPAERVLNGGILGATQPLMPPQSKPRKLHASSTAIMRSHFVGKNPRNRNAAQCYSTIDELIIYKHKTARSGIHTIPCQACGDFPKH